MDKRQARFRMEPYDLSVMSTEKWRRYWIGKTLRVRAAVEEYLVKYATPEQVTQPAMEMEYGVSGGIIRMHLQWLVEAGLILGPYVHARKAIIMPRGAAMEDAEDRDV